MTLYKYQDTDIGCPLQHEVSKKPYVTESRARADQRRARSISMLDMYSLCWKLNLVEKGIASREILLPTYESERKGIA